MELITTSATREFEWKFTNFRRQSVDTFESQKFIFTDKFYIFLGDMETKWKFGVEITKSTFGVYSYLLEAKSKDFIVKLDIYVEAECGEKKFSRSFEKIANELTISGWGWKGYLEIDDIFNKLNNILIHDEMILKIKMELTKDVEDEKQICNKCESELLSLKSNYQNLHNSSEFSDFKFICSDGKEISAHKAILAANSTVMRAMLSTQMTESINHKVHVDDIDGDTMLEILRYIYIREVENIEILSPKLLYGAEKYELDRLKERCVQAMIKNLSTENVIEYFILADRHNERRLMGNCMRFIVSNYQKIRKTDNWNRMDTKLLSILMDYIHSMNYVQKIETSIAERTD